MLSNCRVDGSCRFGVVWVGVAVVLVSVLFAAGCLQQRKGAGCAACERASAEDSERQAQLANWNKLSAYTLEGDRFDLTELRGKPTVLYFWATWCPQCAAQREVLGELSREWGDRVRIAALSIDDEASTVQRYLRNKPALTYELSVSPEQLEAFEAEGLPTLVFINSAGRVERVVAGPMDARSLRRTVAPLLR